VQVQDIRPKHVRQLRDKFVDTPSQADHLITVLSSMLSWGVVDEWLEMNPCLGMRKLKFGCDGSYEAWDGGMAELFKRRSIPHLWWAAALALYTGQRRADCLKMRRTDYRGGLLYVQQQKTKKKVGIPMHKELAKVWEVLPRTCEYVLTTTTGRQWTDGNFGTAWHRQMREPEFASFREQRLTFHGLRHTAVNALLEAGCTTAQVRAITGQTSEMVEHYAKQVDQEMLARQAIAKVEAASDARAAERGEVDGSDDGQGWLFDVA
jgi:integrase